MTAGNLQENEKTLHETIRYIWERDEGTDTWVASNLSHSLLDLFLVYELYDQFISDEELSECDFDTGEEEKHQEVGDGMR